MGDSIKQIMARNPDNPNILHDHFFAKIGPKGVPKNVMRTSTNVASEPIEPGNSFATTANTDFRFYKQDKTDAPFEYDYFLSLPSQYERDWSQQWPLLLFLHGSGESQHKKLGIDTTRTLRHGIPKMILAYDKLVSGKEPVINIPRPSQLEKNVDSLKKQDAQGDKSSEPANAEACRLIAENFITVSPSLNKDYGYGWSPPILSTLLDEIVERYDVDKSRIHVTGFSMGGFGTWQMASHSPSRFASLVPICGGADPQKAGSIVHVPHWIFHGEGDNLIPVEASTQMVKALKSAGAKDVKYTGYPDLTHDSWTEAYNTPELWKWMLEQKKISMST